MGLSGPLIQCFKEVSWIVCSPGFRSPSREVGCTAALSECRKVTAWQLAAQLLCQIDLLGLKPDAVTYGAGVSCYGRAAQWERSFALFNRAQQQQIQSLDSRLGSVLPRVQMVRFVWIFGRHAHAVKWWKGMPYQWKPLTDPLAMRSMIWQRFI